MTLAAGTTFGPYEIVDLVGAGGMGEVYRARDARLGRAVALKTLPAALARDLDRVRRFEIEARAAGQLSHPNILTIHDVGTIDDRPFIVSELLDGETLRERLNRGALPARKAIEIASGVATGLAEAHQRGIVHRDLKPENLFLTRDGRLKILDFGVAKLTAPDPVKGGSVSTVQLLTEIGSTVGTPGYMAPEQVRGEPVDSRSDIFALGAILQEMLTGIAVFRRDSRIATLNAILESHPPELPDSVAPALRRIVQRCLEKNADERFQSARDLAFALNALSDTAASIAGTSTLPPTRRNVWKVAAAVMTLIAVIAVAAALRGWPRPSPEGNPLKRFIVFPADNVGHFDLSRDGSHLAYTQRTGKRIIYIRPFDRLEPQPLTGSEGASLPFFSPDGKWVGFRAAGKLRKVPTTGGTPITLCDVPEYLGASWSDGGQIVIAQRKSPVMRVSAEGGTLEPITTLDTASGEIDHHSPFVLPGDKALLFTIHAGPEVFRIAVRSLETGQQRTLIDEGFGAQYVRSGHLVYGRGTTLFAVPFDLSRLEITGPAVPILEQVYTYEYDGIAAFAATNDGTLAFLPAANLQGRSLVWVNRDGTSQPLPVPERAYHYVSLSPDGKRLAMQIAIGQSNNIWLYEFATGSSTRVTYDGVEQKPIWTPDGKQLTFASGRGADRHLRVQPLDGSAPAQSVYQAPRGLDVWPGAWTPDGRSLLFVETPPTEFFDIKLISAGQRAAEPLVAAQRPEYNPSVSPDGRWIVYEALDGREEIYVRAFRGGAPRQISTNGGYQPVWSRDGREVFYRQGPLMMAVPVQMTPELTFGKPVTVFEGLYVDYHLGPPPFDVTPDGKRFLMIKRSPDELAVRPIHVVLNWFDELRRRVPSGR